MKNDRFADLQKLILAAGKQRMGPEELMLMFIMELLGALTTDSQWQTAVDETVKLIKY